MIESWSTAKDALGDVTGMSEALIHVHVGLAIFVVAALLLRRRMRSPLPLAIVVLLAAGNELVDFLVPGEWDLATGALDFVNSVIWPLILFLLARRGHSPMPDRVD